MTSSIPVKLRRQIRKRFADYCAYCRTAETLTATTFEFEHIVPRSAGGETAFENRVNPRDHLKIHLHL